MSPDEDPEDRLRVLGVRYGEAGQVAIIAAELDEVDDAQQALLAVYGPVSLAGSALAGLIGYLIARRALAPVRQMTAEAEAIGGSDLSRRLSPPARLDEVGRLARTLNGMLARLDAAIGRERAFAADASHELRTPLAILTAEVELVRDRVDDASRAALDTALDEAARLARSSMTCSYSPAQMPAIWTTTAPSTSTSSSTASPAASPRWRAGAECS